MTDTNNPNAGELPPPRRSFRNSRGVAAGAFVAVLALGAVAGATGAKMKSRWEPQSVMLLEPAPIAKLQDARDVAVAVKGNVAEIFGNKFVLQDSSGRALVDTGPRGQGGNAVTKDEAVTVQGRFDRGLIRAQVIVHADGRNEAFGPPHPHGGPHERHAERGDGPDRGPPPPRADRGPPPQTDCSRYCRHRSE